VAIRISGKGGQRWKLSLDKSQSGNCRVRRDRRKSGKKYKGTLLHGVLRKKKKAKGGKKGRSLLLGRRMGATKCPCQRHGKHLGTRGETLDLRVSRERRASGAGGIRKERAKGGIRDRGETLK